MPSNTVRPSDTPRRANVPRAAPAPPAADGPAVPETYDAQNPAEIAAAQAAEAAQAVADQRLAEKAAAKAEARRQREEREAARPRKTWSLFSLLDRLTSMDGLFREGLPVRYLPKLLFVMVLTLLYIGNTHYGNRMNRNIQRLKQETEDLRADYTTLKSDYMEASKQSEVARKVAALGMVESGSPPFRINVPAGRLDAAALELLPVLTADSLAARVARDSIAAQRADSLAGRRRRGAPDGGDGGPEIIAPPQPDELNGSPVAGAAVGAAVGISAAGRNVRPSVKASDGKPGRSSAQARAKPGLRSAAKPGLKSGLKPSLKSTNKPTKRREKTIQGSSKRIVSSAKPSKSVQKSTTPHKTAAGKSAAAHRSTAQPARR